MRMIAGAIVTLGGSIQWGIATLCPSTNSDTAMVAIGGGMVLCVLGLAALFGFVPKALTD